MIRETVAPFRKVLTEEEIQTVQDAFATARTGDSRRVLLALQLGLASGLRSQEIAGLRWGDLDLEARRIYVPGSIAKGGRPRAWYLLPETVWLLELYREHFAEIRPETPLFPSRKGGRPISPGHVRELIRQAFREAGIARPGLSSHSLRHTFAVRLYKHTRDVELTRRALGHARINTTQIYLQGLADLDFSPAIEAALGEALATGFAAVA